MERNEWAEVARLYQEIRRSAAECLDKALTIGERLAGEKESQPVASVFWAKVKAETGIPQKTGELYIRLFRHRGKIEKERKRRPLLGIVGARTLITVKPKVKGKGNDQGDDHGKGNATEGPSIFKPEEGPKEDDLAAPAENETPEDAAITEEESAALQVKALAFFIDRAKLADLRNQLAVILETADELAREGNRHAEALLGAARSATAILDRTEATPNGPSMEGGDENAPPSQ